MGFTVVTCMLVLVGSTFAMQPAIVERLQPQGIRFTIKDEGYRLVAVHFNINSPLTGVGAGKYNFDVNSKTDPTTTTTTTKAPQTQAPQTKPPNTQAPVVNSHQPIVQSATSSGFGSTQSISSGSGGTAQPQQAVSGTGGGTGGSGTSGSGTVGTGTAGTGTAGSGTKGVGTSGTCAGSSKVQCTSYPCLIFEDNFDFINFDVWEHEITASGGGNWEFQYYTNNRSNSYTKDGVLYIKPTLTSDKYGEQFLTSGTLELYVFIHLHETFCSPTTGNNPGDTCTGPQFYGCSRQGTGSNLINPIQSARLRSVRGFSFKFGKVEVEAKMPKGDWIWPAIWLLPKHNAYGQWPASGEIDIVEARGNRQYTDDKGGPQGYNHMGSTLHFGADYSTNAFLKAHAEKTVSGNLADSWHKFFLDGAEILNLTPDSGGFWKLGGLDKTNYENPWRYASKMAPFDQEFYFVLNVAVGGIAYFPDKFHNSPAPKPWNDHSKTAPLQFWSQRNNWYPTWNPKTNNGEDAAMKINYIRYLQPHWLVAGAKIVPKCPLICCLNDDIVCKLACWLQQRQILVF
ncbi:hypothetical protein KUTeg_010200 [Tegillarca granosa]|uniref:Uncharacterized protein n=1 Tax=Tegillarca granosa TaxID=220873 RepID=A0ABQ9F8Z7_TEGGR|nr:hypothetical protein KUTeg_010200 [Tegillarca granosa]